jgi:hypothetical protein
MFNKVRTLVSFIDLLGCALGASIVLMLIFAESKQQAGLEAGSPRDFIYAEFKVGRPEAYIQVNFKTPDKEIVSLDLKNGVIQYDEDGFIKLTNPNFYAWGPFYKKNGSANFDTQSKFYAIYGTSEEKNDWEFAVTYYSDEALDWDNSDWSDKTKSGIVDSLNKTKTNIEFRFQNITLDTTFFYKDTTKLPIILKMGQTKDFKIFSNDEN